MMYNISMENSLILKKKEGDIWTQIKSILAFFDIFEHPLTLLEISVYLGWEGSLAELLGVLEGRPGAVSSKNGFYFLYGREETIGTRQKRYNYSRRKLAIAHRFARLFSLCPFVQAVALANSIGSHNLRDESDIDFFIISSSGRLWLTRLYCAGLAKFLNRRPTKNNKRDRICLSFYISTDHLNLDDLKLLGGDPYFEYWQRSLVWLYDRKITAERFRSANGLNQERGILEREKKELSVWEKLAKHWQLFVMPPVLKNQISKTGVVISDSVLKLYARDRRQEFLDKLNEKLHALP